MADLYIAVAAVIADCPAHGATVTNKKADNTVCLDRKLITAASPQASSELGKLAAKTPLEHAENKHAENKHAENRHAENKAETA